MKKIIIKIIENILDILLDDKLNNENMDKENSILENEDDNNSNNSNLNIEEIDQNISFLKKDEEDNISLEGKEDDF